VDDTRDRIVRKGDYIHGSFLKPEVVDGYINGVNPGDRADVLGRFPFSEASADEAVELARAGARIWRRVPIADRLAAVRRFRDNLARFQERLARLITREVGKPMWESRQEVQAAVRALDQLLDEGVALLAPKVIEEIGARSDYLPRGVVCVLSSYNFPVLLPATNTAAAILAGNAVVTKASKFTPGVGQAVAEMWDRCKLPRGTFNLVQGPGTVVGQRMATNPNIDCLLFNGSFETAASLRQLLADRPTMPFIAQTGGKGLAIVLDDAEVDQAVYEIMVGAFLTAGQRHNSTGRVIVCEGIYDKFINELVDHTSRVQVGYGFRNDVFMGPLVSENLRSRYRRYARQLAARGHQALLEAGPYEADRRGFYAKPAIYRVHWDNGHAFLGDEPPGPMLLVYKVANWQEAAALHNQSAYRLATSVFGSLENPVIAELRDRLRTGSLNINRGTIGASLRLPSVGLGRSSNGVPGGIQLLHALTSPRAQLVETRSFEGTPVLPGTHWHAPAQLEPTVDIEDGEEDDLVLE
jgi:acyl-CoA reductase-like NAD-dependent aldehyde dehydrogenase